jgi:hypothetical protein
MDYSTSVTISNPSVTRQLENSMLLAALYSSIFLFFPPFPFLPSFFFSVHLFSFLSLIFLLHLSLFFIPSFFFFFLLFPFIFFHILLFPTSVKVQILYVGWAIHIFCVFSS